jgi:prepilin peptidase CpaA
VVLIAAFITHRLARRIPAIRSALPGWESWTRKDFPMGLALSGTLIGYFALALRTPV